MENSINLLIHWGWGGMEYVNCKQFLFQIWIIYLIIHNDHGASEEIMMSNYASEPLGGRVLSIYSHSVSIQGVRTLHKNLLNLLFLYPDFHFFLKLRVVPENWV